MPAATQSVKIRGLKGRGVGARGGAKSESDGVAALRQKLGVTQRVMATLLGVTERQIEAVKKAGGPRLLVVGGAGLLEVAPGATLIKSGYLPAEYLPIATSHEKALAILRGSDINWTYLSPGAYFVPGERTGKFRLGTKELVSDAKGESKISFADYAIALVDEIKKPAHERASFSVGY